MNQQKQRMTAEQRRWARRGTKRFAMDEMRSMLRRYAKAKRERAQAYTVWSLEQAETLAFGNVLGARGALRSVGALSDEQYERVGRRLDRIITAKITRGPLRLLKEAA